MSYTLFEHQKKMLELVTNNDRFLILAEVGTGKTLPLCIHASNLLISGEIEDVLIVAPLSGLGAWKRDIKKLSPERQALMRKAVTFINYDKLSRKSSKYQKECWKSWGMVILDEGHAIAKPSSNRTQYFVGKGKALGLASKCAYFYELTGTLINNSRLEDLWAPMRAILGDDWMTWADFKRHFLVTINLPGTYAEIVTGYRHREELLDIVSRYSYRVLKKDCLDLPKVQPDEVILVPWADGKNAEPFAATTRKLYEDAMDSYVDALDMVMDNPLVRRLRLRQIATGHIKESDTIDECGRRTKGTVYPLKSLKAQYAMERIEANLPKKTVCFYEFTETCHALEKLLTKRGIKYITLNGEQKDKDIWTQFQSDPSIKVIITQYVSGSSAIDLYASSVTIFLEPTDSTLNLTQAKARTDRNGQTESCEYVFLLTENSIEVEMYKRLQQHRDFDDKAWKEVAMNWKRQRGE